jgi:hypothetical protein
VSYTKEELSQMTPRERQQVIRDCQDKMKSEGKKFVDGLKKEKAQHGTGSAILSAIGAGILAILLGGGS